MRQRLTEDSCILHRLQDPPQFCGRLTPLQSAVHCQHELCVKFLIKSGAQLEARNPAGYTALYLAIYGRQPSLVSLLLQLGANPNYEPEDSADNRSTDHRRSSWYFYLACSFGFVDIARSLAAHGANPESFWSSGSSGPLPASAAQVSALTNNPECLFLALKHGAVTDFYQLPRHLQVTSLQFYSLVHLSVEGKSFHLVESVEKVTRVWSVLNHFGARMDFRDAKGRTVHDRLLAMHVSSNQRFRLEENFWKISFNPLNLQSLCRIVIRQSLGYRSHLKIPKLDFLPTAILSFLRFDDFEL